MTTKVDATKRVADEVRGLMAKRRVSQAELGEWLNISQAGVARRLAGRVAFDVNELEVIASGFGVPIAELIREG